VLPARAQSLAREVAGRMLELIAQSLPALLAGLTDERDAAEIRHIQDQVGLAFAKLDAVAAEAQRERMTSLAAAPEPGPLRRTLLRLRHDLIMIGRAASAPLPEPLRTRLAPHIGRIAETAADYLRQNSAALWSGRGPASQRPFEAALESYLAEIAEVRRLRLTRDLPVEAVEQIFALGFALEQLHQNFGDLARVVTDHADPTQRAHEARPAE